MDALCKTILVIILMLGTAGTAASQTPPSPQTPQEATAGPPRAIAMSGTLVDASGQPRPGQAALIFSLYKERQGGVALWVETQNVETDERGRYTIWLG